MRKLLFILICVCTFVFQGNAQANADNGLKLSEQQKQQFLQVQKERSDAMEAIFSLRKENPSEFKAKAIEISTNADKRMKTILNESQWAAYSRMQKQAKTLMGI